MKQKSHCGSRPVLLLLSGCFFLFSCGSVQHFQQDAYASRDADRKSFVQTKEGRIIEADEARLRTPLFKMSSIELDRNTRIPVNEIEAYQDNTAYYRRIEGRFAPRIKKGPINMYRSTEAYTETNMASGPQFGMTRTRYRPVYHLQKGDNAGTVRFGPDVIRGYVQDYAPAMEFMHLYDENRRKSKTWSYINTAVTLGGLGLLLAKGIDSKNEEVTTAGYAGAGLFVGGIVSGFVNKFRKARNYKNLELAIDGYNSQVNFKKR